MYGWRARIGLLIPSNNTVIEPEFYRLLPDGVSAHGTRMLFEGINDDATVAMEAQAERGIKELVGAKVDVVMYACMGTTFAKERGWGEEFRKRAEQLSGLTCSTASLAMLGALRRLGVRRIAVGTPYPAFIDERVRPFFEDNGFSVISLCGLGIGDMHEVVRQPPGVAYRLGREVDHPDAEAICLLATDFRTIEALEPLERDLGKPVISTNQAILWQALCLTGVRESVQGVGQLLRLTGLYP